MIRNSSTAKLRQMNTMRNYCLPQQKNTLPLQVSTRRVIGNYCIFVIMLLSNLSYNDSTPNIVYNLNDLYLNMSVQRYHSLPKKTQPTRSHSSLPHHTNTLQNCNTEPHLVCPQTSQFRSHKYHHQVPYIHNLHIDYGHLEQPVHLNVKQVNQKMQKIKEKMELLHIPQQMQTKRLTGISLWDQVQIDHNNSRNTQKKSKIKATINLNLNTIDTHQHSPNSKQIQTLPTSNAKDTQYRHTKKSRIKLQQVRAYKQNRHQIQPKKLHSRIVKMVVGGAIPRTKVICYPDNSQYLKLCVKK